MALGAHRDPYRRVPAASVPLRDDRALHRDAVVHQDGRGLHRDAVVHQDAADLAGGIRRARGAPLDQGVVPGLLPAGQGLHRDDRALHRDAVVHQDAADLAGAGHGQNRRHAPP